MLIYRNQYFRFAEKNLQSKQFLKNNSKVYIENHIRLCNIEASKLNGKDDFSNTEVHVDMERLQRVREIVKDVKIKNPKDIVKICDKKLFSRKERQEIRDFVFAGITTPDGKKKAGKTE